MITIRISKPQHVKEMGVKVTQMAIIVVSLYVRKYVSIGFITALLESWMTGSFVKLLSLFKNR